MGISDIRPAQQALLLQLVEESFRRRVVRALDFQIWKLRPERPELRSGAAYGIVNLEHSDRPVERSAETRVAAPPFISARGCPQLLGY